MPVAVVGALVPNDHPGYELPIGGVLATENAVIPNAVGVGIGCRMKLTFCDQKAKIVKSEPRFGSGCTLKCDKAWTRLGSSGSGNHFVDFGSLRVSHDELGMLPGACFALPSHSGSHSTGAQDCDVCSKRAKADLSNLPEGLKHLACLSVCKKVRYKYWIAMNLMGRHAVAHYELIPAGLDKVPSIFKDIHTVIAAQTDLVELFGKFHPKIVKM